MDPVNKPKVFQLVFFKFMLYSFSPSSYQFVITCSLARQHLCSATLRLGAECMMICVLAGLNI